jgi:ABC-type nitrate/sulfonate/bicarbonate transport system substrate-binding protein
MHAIFRGILAAGLALGFAANTASAADEALRVYTFPTARALPFHAAIAKGIYARYGLNVEVEFTENSRALRDGLASGKYQIVHSAADNAIDMIEVGRQNVVIVTGGDSGTNEFYVQADVGSFADMRGRILVVDAPDTAYALQAKKILARQGLNPASDYTIKPVGNGSLRLKSMLADKSSAGAVLNLPFTLQAKAAGMKSLGRLVDILGPYQAGAAYTLRPWAEQNPRLLERYIAAFVEAVRWSRDSANRNEAVALLVERLKLSPDIAAQSYDLMQDASFGFAPDARFNPEGFRNVLALRAEVEGGTPSPPERYVDLSYYQRALTLVGCPARRDCP